MADVFEFAVDEDAARELVEKSDGLRSLVESKCEVIAQAANASSAGNLTQETVRWDTKEHVGGTAPAYISRVKYGRKGLVGIVSTGNYAARKDNHENNTLVKSIGAANG